MKRFLPAFGVCFFALSLAAQTSRPAAAPQSAPGSQSVKVGQQTIPIPPLPEFHPQKPKRVELSNGVLLFLQEDHELPLIDGQVRIRGGSRNLPADKTGMMSVYGQSWRTGGTEAKTGDQLDDLLEARAAKVETSGASDSTFLSWSCLKGDFNDVFAIVAELLQHPAFRQDKVDLAKRQLNGAISRRNDDIDSIAAREAVKLAYGKENPYARTAEYATVAAVTRDELLAWHKRTMVGANIMVGVVGDFDSTQMEAALRRVFEALPRGQKIETPNDQPMPAKPGVYFAAKEDVNQAEIRMVAPSPLERKNPDYYAVEVMDQAFWGGGFSSRLFEYIRTKRGLAYSAGGGFSIPYDHPGLMELSAGTKSQSAVETVQAIYEELGNIEKNPITPQELRRAKDAILNSFIFAVDSKDKLLREQMSYAFYGYPADFLEQIRAGIEKVTAEDVTRVEKKYVHPKELAVLVVGNQQDFGKPLSTVGEVTALDISIPPPPGAGGAKPAAAAEKPGTAGNAAPPSAADQANARALLQKMMEHMGGAAKINAVKAVQTSAKVPLKGPQGSYTAEVQQLKVYPDKIRQQVQLPMGQALIVITEQGGFMSVGGQTQDMPAAMRKDGVDELKRDEIYVLQHAADVNVVPAGTEKIGSVTAQALTINSSGVTTTWYVDAATGTLLRVKHMQNTPEGPAEVTADPDDWRSVDGVLFAFKEHRTQNGEDNGTVEVTDVKVNPPVDAKAFEKPGPPQ